MFSGLIRIIFLLYIISIFACGGDVADVSETKEVKKEKPPVVKVNPDVTKPINFTNIRGTWRLKYPNNYGYEFRLSRNYRAIVILFLKDSSLVFRGIYTIDDDNTFRITLSEMKRVDGIRNINVYSRFVKTKSSYFLFVARYNKKERKLLIRPKKISIDGNDSQGYFEPLISLKKIR